MSNDSIRGFEVYTEMREAGILLLNMRAVEEAIVRGAGGGIISKCAPENAFYDSKGTAEAIRSIFGSILSSSVVAQCDKNTVFPVSLVPCPDQRARRAGRLLSMVHELHKAGYQRLRICAGFAPYGSEWRCLILPAHNVRSDGWTPVSSAMGQEYTSNQDKQFFGWVDADGDDARRLAVKFIERFPELTKAATAGQDWPYAGWFSSILGRAENGSLPAFYAGTDMVLPEPATPLPPPPPGSSKNDDVGETGQSIILHADLTLGHLPPGDANYERLCIFCLSYDAYRSGLRTIKDCETIADRTEREGLASATIERLRVTAFIRQRAIKWADQWPPNPRLISTIRAVIEEIRRRLNQNEIFR